MINILYLVDSRADAKRVEAEITAANLTCRITQIQTQAQFRDTLRQDHYDVILSGYRLQMYDGISALRLSQKLRPDIPFIFVSGTSGEEAAIEAFTSGATDYVPKRDLSRLGPAVQRALHQAHKRRDRKQADAALQRSNDLLRAIIKAAPTAIIDLDLDGNVRSIWNSAAEKMLGWRAEEVIGRPLPSVPLEKKEEFKRFRELIRKGKTLEAVEVQRQKRDGTPIDYSIYASPLYNAEGGITGNIVVLVDITERKKAEHERLANLKFFESMDQVNRAMQGAGDLKQMMSDVLDAVISIFDCDRAYLLFPCDPEADSWVSPMERCKPEYPGALALNLKMPMNDEVAETLRILRNADGPVKFGPESENPLPKDVAEHFDIKCFLAMALYPKVGKPWQFGIHQCSHVRIWRPEEETLFREIGRRLEDSLTSLLSYRDLRENEDFLNNIVENIPNMIFVKNAQTLRFVRINKAGEQLLGYSREELLGKNDYDLFPKEAADFFTCKDRDVLESGKYLDISQETVRNKNNIKRILHTQKIPIMDDTGIPQYLLGISEDITEKKRTEESVRKLSQAIEQSPVSIIITDARGKIEFVNSTFAQITGYSYDEAIGKNPRILKSGATSDKEYRKLWKDISSGRVWRGEFYNRKKSGELFWEHATIAPVRNPDDVITHYVAVKEDITERKKLEGQLHQAQKMEAIGQLAGGVAHDFNNMLGVIIGHSDLVLDLVDETHPLFSNLVEIRNAARRSADLTRQLLAFARKQTVMPKVLDLNLTIEGMLKILQRLIGEGIELLWRPGGNIWPVKVDPSQIDQIMANLCVNARDAIAGVGKIIIETKNAFFDSDFSLEHPGAVPGEYVQLTVTDTGAGINEETLGKIFEPFYTTKGKGKGTGLGLATVYGIVKQNEGFINVYSEPGYGSTFNIFLPRHAAMTGETLKTTPTVAAKQGNETILVVEDESTMLSMVKLMLESCGYRILAASTPGEAKQIADEHTGEIHLVITDVVLPEMNGRDLLNEINQIYPEIAGLFMSGYSDNIIAHHGVLDEGVNFIQKPFSKHALAAKVREVLNSK